MFKYKSRFIHRNVVISIFLTVSCFTSSGAVLSANFASEEELKSLSVDLETLRRSKSIPGLAVAIVKDGQRIWSNGYGYADSNKEIPVTPDTPFWLASLTKTFVGLAYLQLEQHEKLDLDERAAKTPNFDALCNWLSSTTIEFAAGLNCDAPITIRHILHHQVNDKPGTAFMYNPIMYSRLSRHLEHRFGLGANRVEGRHNYLGQIINDRILVPAGMTRSMASMWDRSRMASYFDLADGFSVDDEGDKRKLPRPDKHIAGGAGVVSTANDMAKYDIALSSLTILTKQAEQQLLRPAKFEDGGDSPYGFGWYFQCHKGQQLMWHSGWDPDHGFSALHLRIPSKGISFIILANSEGVWWHNPLDAARIDKSDFARLFLDRIDFEADSLSLQPTC